MFPIPFQPAFPLANGLPPLRISQPSLQKKHKKIYFLTHKKARGFRPWLSIAGKLRIDLFLFCFCCYIFAEIHQHCCYLCSDCSTLRCQSGFCHTVYNAVGICPLHCFYSIAADGSAVCIACQISLFCNIIAFHLCITVQDCRQLFSGNGIAQTKCAVIIACYNTVCICPNNGICVPCLLSHPQKDLRLCFQAVFPCCREPLPAFLLSKVH